MNYPESFTPEAAADVAMRGLDTILEKPPLPITKISTDCVELN